MLAGHRQRILDQVEEQRQRRTQLLPAQAQIEVA
jgi:heme exporter protein D